MPELPEVETTRKGIEPWVTGRVVTGVEVRNPRLRWPVAPDLGTLLEGKTVRAVRRRAKYLIFDFQDGGLLIHLGMSGSLRMVPADESPGPHDHVDLIFGDHLLRYRDPRRFGSIQWCPGNAEAHPLLKDLGPEPLGQDFDAKTLHTAFRSMSIPVKQALMNARCVVGVGNIYASESLFRSRIHPLTPASGISLARCGRLVESIRRTLEDAIEAGGSSLKDFVGSDGQPGYFQQQYHVYARHGKPCRICGATIIRETVGQRATFWCPCCQRK